MDRRNFLKRGVKEVASRVVSEADTRVRAQAARWIRPPFAQDELELLLSCTRCGDCIEACPHRIIFPLPASQAPQAAGTPALDLLHHGCHLCADWPCVTACKVDVLRLPVADEAETSQTGPEPGNATAQATPPLRPRIAVVAIDTETCLPYAGPECGACRDSCPVPGAMVWDGERPLINSKVCTGCALCREACILDPRAITVRSLYDNRKL